MTLPERLLTLHAALDRRRIPHAFGGAIALAYRTLDPRGTSDIDVNVFVPAADAQRVLEALPNGVAHEPDLLAAIARDGQTRVWWDETPLDLFFNSLPVHDDAARNREFVPFEGQRIPVLGPVELAVFKVMFDRTRDWADIEAMLAAGALDVEVVRRALATLLDSDDPRLDRLAETVRRVQRADLANPGHVSGSRR